jgi:hypothetical protein
MNYPLPLPVAHPPPSNWKGLRRRPAPSSGDDTQNYVTAIAKGFVDSQYENGFYGAPQCAFSIEGTPFFCLPSNSEVARRAIEMQKRLAAAYKRGPEALARQLEIEHGAA